MDEKDLKKNSRNTVRTNKQKTSDKKQVLMS